MAIPKTPGVFIEEIPTLPASVAPVATAIPAFIGYTEKAVKNGEDLTNVPTRITSFLEFEEIFGGPKKESISITLNDSYDETPSGMTLVDRKVSAALAGSPTNYKLYYSIKLFFDNGGGPCYIVSVGPYGAAPGTILANELIGGLAEIAKEDEPTLLVFSDHMTIANYKTVYDTALAQCESLQDRFVIMDVKEETSNSFTDATNFRTTGVGIDNLKYGAVYYPFLKTTISFGFDEEETVTQNQAFIGDNPAPPPFPAKDLDGKKISEIQTESPSVYRMILAEIGKILVTLPPSGAMAGIFARVDRERGVWKAPANVGVRSVVGPARIITNEQQEDLNVDATSGKSINAIRAFTGKGTIVWGARTLAGNDNEWRYVPVRRLFIFVEESVKKATEFVVFEPNDANTWLRVKTMIENFLTQLWRDGALAGAKPEDAFFVRVGLGTTMTPVDILEGRMNVEIGMAAVRPAEFIILKFSHKLQQS